MEEIVLGDPKELRRIMEHRVSLSETEKAMVTCTYNMELDVETFHEIRIGDIKDQVLAWKTINYLCYARDAISHTKTSSYRTTWKKMNAPDTVRQITVLPPPAEKKTKTVIQPLPKVKTDEPPTVSVKKEEGEEDDDELFDNDAIYRRQIKSIQKLEKKRDGVRTNLTHLQQQFTKYEQELEIIQNKLEKFRTHMNQYYGMYEDQEVDASHEL